MDNNFLFQLKHVAQVESGFVEADFIPMYFNDCLLCTKYMMQYIMCYYCPLLILFPINM